jgi:ATP-dependent DNA helicase PIF1
VSDEEELEEVDAGEDSEIVPDEIYFDDSEFGDLYSQRAEDIAPTRCEFLCGCAGSGKTYEILRRVQEDPDYAVLSASTGISAVNLSATTIHSLLGFSDLTRLRDAVQRRSIHRKLRELVEDGYRNVVIDEVSMISHQMLDILVEVFDDVNEDLRQSQAPIGLILVGDFAQLAPISDDKGKRKFQKVPWAFDAQHWSRFEANTTRLTGSYRHADQRFLDALNHARAGRGMACVEGLAAAGLEFQTYADMEFEGTTILSKNDEVESFNREALKRVRGRDMYLPSRRWGVERREWDNIPERSHMRENAYVMILANQPAGRGQFEYVNGDCGYVRGITQRAGSTLPYINVELVRTGQVVKVAPIVRAVEHRDKPEGFSAAEKVDDIYYAHPHYNRPRKMYISGQVQYYPIRLAFGTTCHKAQGLTLDRVQVDIRSWMFRKPAMTYIAMSRCRTLEGLRLVGQKEVVAAACNADPRVTRWL